MIKIAIFGNTYNGLITTYLKVLYEFLNQNNVSVLVEKELFQNAMIVDDCCLDNVEIIENENFICDYAISIGGDGTFLKTASLIGDKPIPVLGINIGRLDFLADLPAENMIQAVKAMLNGQLITEERTLLKVER